MTNSLHVPPSGTPALPRARVIYGVDATGSRSAAWKVACDLQAQMFREAGAAGTLNLQLVYYGGSSCRASRWATSGEQLAQWMDKIQCEAGMTQIERILRHSLAEHAKAPIQAIAFIGDAVEEQVDVLAGLAGRLGAAGVPLHMYQEGDDVAVRKAFRLLALRSGGTYSAFNPAIPETIERLSAQLNEVARLAVNSTLAIGTDRSAK
jgi:hypothetical protein